MLKSKAIINNLQKVEYLCNAMSIKSETAIQYLCDELTQLFILSKIKNPMFLKTNGERLNENLELFEINSILLDWKECYNSNIRYRGEPFDSISTEKWKTELFENQKLVRCTYCKKFITKDNSEVDHYIPKDCKGFDTKRNFRISCNPCNNGKRQLPSVLLFNVFNFASYFSQIAYEGKQKLSKKERFQILQWADFKCSKCLSDSCEISVYYIDKPDVGGSAVFGNSIVLCINCANSLHQMEVIE